MGDAREPSGEVAEQLAAGLWRRLRDVMLVAERIETYSFTEREEPPNAAPVGEEAEALATDVIVRALHDAGDPDGWRLLSMIADRGEGAPLVELAQMLGRPRLAVVERVNGLVQAGLVQRALDLDRALATPAGEVIVRFVRDSATRLGERAAAFRSDKREPSDVGDVEDGLSLL